MDRRPSSPGSSARAAFSKFKGSMPDKLSTLQTKIEHKISQVPDKLSQVPDKLSQVPDKLSQVPDKLQDFQRETYNRLPKGISLPEVATAPEEDDPEYDPALAGMAEKILYRAGIDPLGGGPLLVLCAASFPDAKVVDYNALLPYVLKHLPSEEELGEESEGGGYSVVFFSGGGGGGNDNGGESWISAGRGNRPSWAWTLQAYHLLGRAAKKRIRKLWVVHERAWVRVILEIMAGVVSVKFRKKVVHVGNLTDLANHLDITQLHIPPAVYLHDRKLSQAISIPNPPPPVFGHPPFHTAANPPRVGENMPLPQALVDTTRYLRSSCLLVEGLFRVPPSQALLDIIREAYDRKQYIKWEEWGPHTAAGLVKLYYRSLPEPVIPSQFYHDMFLIEDSDVEDEKVFLKIKDLLEDGLPKSSRVLFLRHLLPLMALVAQNSGINKMSPKNLAVCVSPSLLRSDDMMADAKACNGLRKFLEIAIQRVEDLAPELPSRASPKGNGGDVSSVKPPTSTESSPPYSMGSVEPVQRQGPEVTSSKEMEGGVTGTKSVPGNASSSPAPPPTTSGAVTREETRPPATLVVAADETLRRGSVPTIPAMSNLGGGSLQRKSSFQTFANGPPEIGREPLVFSSSLTPDPSPYLPTSSFPKPRAVRRAASSTFPSSSSLRSSSFSSSNVATITNSLNQSQPQIQMKGRAPPPVIQRASSEIWGTNGRGKVVEELRALYEERARGVEVLVRNVPAKGQGRGRRL